MFYRTKQTNGEVLPRSRSVFTYYVPICNKPCHGCLSLFIHTKNIMEKWGPEDAGLSFRISFFASVAQARRNGMGLQWTAAMTQSLRRSLVWSFVSLLKMIMMMMFMIWQVVRELPNYRLVFLLFFYVEWVHWRIDSHLLSTAGIRLPLQKLDFFDFCTSKNRFVTCNRGGSHDWAFGEETVGQTRLLVTGVQYGVDYFTAGFT